MTKEWHQTCKDCAAEYGYSDFSLQIDVKKGFSRPERCARHRQQHAKEIRNLANSHFDLKPIQDPPSILGTPYLGEVTHEDRSLKEREVEADSSSMDIGITDDDIRDVYKALETHQVLVIVGPTGSGKSTYVPYRLLSPLPSKQIDHYTQKGPIVVTQPRIQATRGIPDTVGKLLLGSSVGPGFEIGFRHGSASGKAKGEQTDTRNRLVFVTDGTLLNWISDGRIGEYSVIIIDEAHERSCNIDLILGLLKRELPRYPHLKLIVASATIDADKFVRYYNEITPTKLLTFEGKRNHGYTLHWWTKPSVEYDQTPKVMADNVLEIIAKTQDGGVLGFLPGQKEINEAANIIRNGLKNRQDVKVFPLYTALGVRLGDEALQPLKKVNVGGKWITPRRVVIATNVAETSITIPDVVYVVDAGFIKMTEWNSATCRQELVPKRHSQNGCKQRWGRAGRVRKGDVYTLYNEEDYGKFPEHTPPEITRSCLDSALLTSKAAGIAKFSSFSWIDEPAEEEKQRCISVIKNRGLIDADDDLTEEGLEVYHLSRSISRLLDKSDYNSTQRSLDVASLLILADRYGCLLEAATILVIMPRMGSSLYWQEDGLLIWDAGWDVASKDRVARVHQSLRTGCRDDLDFAFKLFSEYEQNAPTEKDATVHSWCQHNLVNAKNLVLVESAREGILKAFTRGKKDPSLRPLNDLMIERLRMLMVAAWPDRLIQIRPGEPALFFQSEGQAQGIVSPNCCGDWTAGEKAIVGIMDQGFAFINGKHQRTAMANFLIREPRDKRSKDEAEISSALANLRKSYKPQAARERLFFDLFYPVGTRVRLKSTPKGLSIAEVLSQPRLFKAKRTRTFDMDEQTDESARFYERFSLASDKESWEPDLDDDFEDDFEIDEPEFVIEHSHSQTNGFSPPDYPAAFDRKPDRVPDEAVVLSWKMIEGSPAAVVGPVFSKETINKFAAGLKIGQRIKATIIRSVQEQHSGEYAGFIAVGPNGIEIPLPMEDLSIPLRNPSIGNIEGQTISLTVTQCSSKTFRVSRLSDVEKDLEELLRIVDVKGTVSKIDQNSVYISIPRADGIIQCGSLPKELALRILPDLKTGMEIFFSLELTDIKKSPASINLDNRISLTKEDLDYLGKFNIRLVAGKVECKERLSYESMSTIASFNPKLYAPARVLYSRTWDLHFTNLETIEKRRALAKLIDEVRAVRKIVTTADPKASQSQLISIRNRAQQIGFPQISWKKLSDDIDEVWTIRQNHMDQQFISRLQDQIRDLENRIARTNDSDYIQQARIWIKEKQDKIDEVKRRRRRY